MPCMFPLVDDEGVLMSACASTSKETKVLEHHVEKKSKRALYPEHNSIRIVLKTSCKGAKADTVVPSQSYGHLGFFWS